MSTAVKTVSVRISGRVQGVWFRDWTRRTAAGLGLDGWVRNRPDGTVEALFSGAAPAVERMLKLCETGPSAAHVTGVAAQPADHPPAQSGFVIR